ncbi:Putative major facilitator superfamily, MFS transporter superfamily [Septoria linicola]|uniref:Major facilitator superfamily, MFS transporter superfamily n=1 Tax=Septoria linicola TaxID=215465 RepID=A0A9Q9AJC8_9PEZI|nr:putative major facilitator superfamily, MFS transporter superfamily [Septoria linicola]USW47515.1 Putative major facilitator superfamily, MFS transporter superfamily [Septoria linicola]
MAMDPTIDKTPRGSSPDSLGAVDDGDSEKDRIERLGCQRPPQLASLWQEIGFVFSITVSQLSSEYFVSGFTILLPTIANALDIAASSQTWPASVFSLVIASFLLPFGRLGDIHGCYPVYIGGCAWYCVWSLIAGFSKDEVMLNICRAIQGLGPAAYLPAGLQLLGSMYRPGPRKNLISAVYGAMAPLGFFVGLFFAGVSGEFATWRWYFWIGAILVFIVTITSCFCIPSDMDVHQGSGTKMDWLGSVSIISGLVLVVFAITSSSHEGWTEPYILVTFLLGVAALATAFWLEGWIVAQPLLAFDVFTKKHVRPFMVGLLFAYSTLGIYLLYASLFRMNVLGAGPMQLVAWYTPTAIVGVALAVVGGAILHIVPPLMLLIVTGLAIIIESVLLAMAPADAGYWQWIFIPMIMSTLAVDIVFTVSNVFFTSAMPARQQGLAGSIASVLLHLGMAILLGFAELVATETAYQGLKASYQNVFWYNLARGATCLVVFVAFVRIPRQKSDLTADEKAQRQSEISSETR